MPVNNLLLFVFLLCLPKFAFAWGKVGHEATALILDRYLSSRAKSEVRKLLGSENVKSLGTWADQIRSQWAWRHSKTFHFTQVEDHETYYQSLSSEHFLADKSDAILALVKAEDVLRSSKANSVQKTYALKFLVHLVGDIHQPMHTGRPKDLGGNLVIMNWLGRRSNLHAVWDSGILGATYAPELDLDAETYVARMDNPSRATLRAWQRGSFLEWHVESQDLRTSAYDVAWLPSEETVSLFGTTVKDRIQQAGYRTALLLNDIFEGRRLSSEGVILRSELEKVLGPGYLDKIRMEPVERIDGLKDLHAHPFDGHECH